MYVAHDRRTVPAALPHTLKRNMVLRERIVLMMDDVEEACGWTIFRPAFARRRDTRGHATAGGAKPSR